MPDAGGRRCFCVGGIITVPPSTNRVDFESEQEFLLGHVEVVIERVKALSCSKNLLALLCTSHRASLPIF